MLAEQYHQSLSITDIPDEVIIIDEDENLSEYFDEEI